MKRVVRLLVALCLAAAALAPVATASDRMWIGFHDDPMLRYDGGRQEAMDRARANGATILRTLVDWRAIAQTKPVNASDPFDAAYRFDDLDEFVRNAQARGIEILMTIWGTPGWANGDKKAQYLPTNMTDFQAFTKALASRYSGRYAGYPYVRFYSIWNESNLATFLVPQFNAQGKIVSPAAYAKLAAAGYAGIKSGNGKALVAIGETSSNGRDRKKPGRTDTVAPGTFAKLVAAANKKLKFDAWAHHPYAVPVNQAPTQRSKWPNVTLTSMPMFETSLDQFFGRKKIPVWITEYGSETKPGEPKGVTESQQAKYLPEAISLVKKDARVPLFIWFVMQDSTGSLWQSGIYRDGGAAKAAQRKFGSSASPLNATNPKLSVKVGARNPTVTVYLREYCSNNPAGSTVGYTVRTSLAGKLILVAQGAAPLGTDCTIPVRVNGLKIAKGKSYAVAVAANTATTAQIARTITVVGA